jgi:hypothetical protein
MAPEMGFEMVSSQFYKSTPWRIPIRLPLCLPAFPLSSGIRSARGYKEQHLRYGPIIFIFTPFAFTG